jgi:hypothetical protein
MRTRGTGASVVWGVLCGTVLLPACAPDVGTSSQALVPDASPPAFLTLDPDGWRERCVPIRTGPLLESCQRLAASTSSTDAERATFELNYEASQRVILPHGLSELRFKHGQYAAYSVRDVDRELRQHPDDSALLDLARSINRAFLEGQDAGVLGAWVSTVLCGDTHEIEGPEGAPCGLLDGPCFRGVLRDGCCTMELAEVGTACTQAGGSPGLCDGESECVPAGQVAEADRIRGDRAWIEYTGEGSARSWDISTMLEPPEELTLIAIESEVQLDDVELPDDETPPDEFVSTWGGTLGAPLAELPTELARVRRARVTRRTASDLSGVTLDVSPETGGRRLYVSGAPSRVCVVRGVRIDELGPVLSDCSSAGALAVPCPGEAGGVTCEQAGDHVKITGEALTLAFDTPLPGEPLVDVVPLLLPARICADAGCVRTPIDHRPRHGLGFPRRRPPPPTRITCPCGDPPSCFSVSGGGLSCICRPPRERCDGADNDCDGAIDENPTAICEDGIGCTQHVCRGTAGCELRVEQSHRSCSPAHCAKGMCAFAAPLPTHPSSFERTRADANGCFQALDHEFCEDEWDQCECNGRSFCVPSFAAREGDVNRLTGCSETWAGAHESPCENGDFGGDENLCTLEICCEPNPNCRHLFRSTPTPAAWGTTIIRPDTQPLCLTDLESRPAGPTRDGQSARCVRLESVLSEAEREELGCTDGNACTEDVCINRLFPWLDPNPPEAGRCSHTPRSSGSPAARTISVFGVSFPVDRGCDRVRNEGCSVEHCDSGSCVFAPVARGIALRCQAGDPPGSCGCGDLPADACRTEACAGEECRRLADLCEDDGLDCTNDLCGPDGVTCTHPVRADYCLILGGCHVAGEQTSACQVCDPARSREFWSIAPDWCFIDLTCRELDDDHPDHGACFQCRPQESLFEWTPTPTDPECIFG